MSGAEFFRCASFARDWQGMLPLSSRQVGHRVVVVGPRHVGAGHCRQATGEGGGLRNDAGRWCRCWTWLGSDRTVSRTGIDLPAPMGSGIPVMRPAWAVELTLSTAAKSPHLSY